MNLIKPKLVIYLLIFKNWIYLRSGLETERYKLSTNDCFEHIWLDISAPGVNKTSLRTPCKSLKVFLFVKVVILIVILNDLRITYSKPVSSTSFTCNVKS